MPISGSIVRYTSSSIFTKPLQSSLQRLLSYSSNNHSPSSEAESYMTHLHKDPTHVEKSLTKVKAKLDSKCITQVLEKCSIDKPQLGLRFFIWAGLHQHYRHTSYMYDKACSLLNLERNPSTIYNVLDDYRAEGLVVSVKMFKVILNLCRAAKDEKLGLWVLRKMKEFNCRPDTVSYNVVIRLLVEKGRLDDAMGLMREMGLIDLYPDMVTYISVIKGLCDVGKLEDAFALVKVMKGHGCVPNSVVYSTILDGICRHESFEIALEFLDKMEKESDDCKPNVVAYTSVIKGFMDKGRVVDALSVLDRMNDAKVKPNKVTFIAILDGLCKEGLVDEACKIIDKYSNGGILQDDLYSLLVVSLFRAKKDEESENMFKRMIARGMRPNGSAANCVTKGMVLENRLMDGFSMFDSLAKSGNLQAIDSDTCSILLDGLCREDHFTEAGKVVDMMIGRRIVLKSSHAENIVRYLKISGQHDLASNVAKIIS